MWWIFNPKATKVKPYMMYATVNSARSTRACSFRAIHLFPHNIMLGPWELKS